MIDNCLKYLKCKAYYEDGEIWEGNWQNSPHFWYDSKVLHRDNGPAVIWDSGDEMYCIKGQLHRSDGPAVNTSTLGKEWFLNGKRHRLDGPAIIGNNYKEWWVNDKLHREDGPAVEVEHYESRFNEYYIDGTKGDKKLVERILKYKRKSSLTEYLLDNNECIRFYAEKRLKELENAR